MRKLHPKQEKILELLKANIDSPLTMVELSSAAVIDSPGVLYHHIRQLERKGLLKRNPNNPKDYILFDTPEKKVVYLNKYGLAKCGPDGFFLSGNVEDRIPVATGLLKFPAEEAFIVEASGDSMRPKILDRDIVIAQRQNYAAHNDIVVCVFHSKAIIKKYTSIDRSIALQSLNEDYDPLYPQSDSDFSIQGIVRNIMRVV